MSWLLASWLFTQVWAWDPVDGADSYRIYWSRFPTQWCAQNMREYPASVCVDGECQGFVPKPTWKLTFFMVTAVKGGVEGPTEHGEIVSCN